MALIKCKECGEQVSDKAASCPKCGAPNSKKSKGPSGCMMVFFIIIGVLILLVFIGNVSNKDEITTKAEKNNQVVTEQLDVDKTKNVEIKKEPVPVINWHKQKTTDSVTGEVGEVFYNTSKK